MASQNAVGYYAPSIFQSIGFKGATPSLLASGVYGITKFVFTGIFLLVGIEQFGRRKSLMFGAFFMGLFFLIIGAIIYTHPPDPNATSIPPASIAAATMIYLCESYPFTSTPCSYIHRRHSLLFLMGSDCLGLRLRDLSDSNSSSRCLFGRRQSVVMELCARQNNSLPADWTTRWQDVLHVCLDQHGNGNLFLLSSRDSRFVSRACSKLGDILMRSDHSNRWMSSLGQSLQNSGLRTFKGARHQTSSERRMPRSCHSRTKTTKGR